MGRQCRRYFRRTRRVLQISPDLDEDTATIAVEAARSALKRRDIDPEKIGAVYVGSESHPYAVKPTACTVGEAIGATPNMTAADYEFACKAGTAAIQTCMGLVKSDMITYGVAIGQMSHREHQAMLSSILQQPAGQHRYRRDDPVALINHTCSFTTDTPDFWRREGQDYPRHGGRFTGDPGYFKHIQGSVRLIFDQTGKSAKDYDYAVFHQPNAKFPQRVAKILGFTAEQIKPGLVVPRLGNTYSGSSMIGLAATLDIAKAGDRIFVASFGSGAGSDAFDVQVTDAIESGSFRRDAAPSVEQLLASPKWVDYATYARHKGKIVMQK